LLKNSGEPAMAGRILVGGTSRDPVRNERPALVPGGCMQPRYMIIRVPTW